LTAPRDSKPLAAGRQTAASASPLTSHGHLIDQVRRWGARCGPVCGNVTRAAQL